MVVVRPVTSDAVFFNLEMEGKETGIHLHQCCYRVQLYSMNARVYDGRKVIVDGLIEIDVRKSLQMRATP